MFDLSELKFVISLKQAFHRFQHKVQRSRASVKVGWLPIGGREVSEFTPLSGIRSGTIGNWINKHDKSIYIERYNPSYLYDIVVIEKDPTEHSLQVLKLSQKKGSKVIFDSNVNYYESWGEFFVPKTKPKVSQIELAKVITEKADFVVADSTYIFEQVAKLNNNSMVIADAVDRSIFSGSCAYKERRKLRLIWSGIAQKSLHFRIIYEALRQCTEFIELLLVSNEEPYVFKDLQKCCDTSWVQYTNDSYASNLCDSDVIISPKDYNVNSYEMAHTEYKISLGMAMGLPVVASAQQSYLEAINHYGCGFIAETTEQWVDAFFQLKSSDLRQNLGKRSKQTVDDFYSEEVISKKYANLLKSLVC